MLTTKSLTATSKYLPEASKVSAIKPNHAETMYAPTTVQWGKHNDSRHDFNDTDGVQGNAAGLTGSKRSNVGLMYCVQFVSKLKNLSAPATIGTTPKTTRSNC